MATGSWQRGFNEAAASSHDLTIILGVIPAGHTVSRIILRLDTAILSAFDHIATGLPLNFLVAMTPSSAPVYLDPQSATDIVSPLIMWFEGITMRQEPKDPALTDYVMIGGTGDDPRIMKGQRKNITGANENLYLQIHMDPNLTAAYSMFTQASYSVWVLNA